MKILVLLGGESPEREISIKSGESVCHALKAAGHSVVTVDPILSFDVLDEYVGKVDMVFPVLHGRNGEDGTVQKELEKRSLSYLGADSESSNIAFNKILTHKNLEKHAIKMPRYEKVSLHDVGSSQLFQKAYVLKPFDGGSSLDTLIVREVSEVSIENTKELLSKYEYMLIEELIEGLEITVAILGNDSLPVIAILPPEGEEFDFNNKYNNKSKEICPVPVDMLRSSVQTEAQKIALEVHKILNIRDLSRIDFIVTEDNQIYLLEVNTIPGLRPESLYPKAAAASGLNMTSLVDRFIELVKEH